MEYLDRIKSLESRWRGMLTRCRNPNYHSYHRYGGRGITVCSLWTDSFQEFCHWALANGFKMHLTLDRRNNEGNYTPENCRWVSRSDQQFNSKNCKKALYN